MLWCLSQLREDDNIHEPNFGLGYPILDISFDDNFEYAISSNIVGSIDTP